MTASHVPAAVFHTLAAAPAARRAVLFGSRAQGDAGPRTDLDLAVDALGTAWARLWADVQDADTLLGLDGLPFREPELRRQIGVDGATAFSRP